MHELPIRDVIDEGIDDVLPDRVWDHLVSEGIVRRYIDGETTTPNLVAQARSLLSLFRDRPHRAAAEIPAIAPRSFKAPSDDLRGLRNWAMSSLVAEHGRDDQFVKDFRKRDLNGELLEPEGVEDWINERAELDGPPSEWLQHLPIPRGYKRVVSRKTWKTYVEPELVVSEEEGASVATMRSLDYIVPDDPSVKHQAIAAGGVLERLLTASQRLARMFTWDPSQATVFVLTDHVPFISDSRSDSTLQFRFSGLSRVVLTVDPALSPLQVASEYRRARKQLLGQRRHRSLTEKHLRLAIFFGESPDNETWKERFRRWNEASIGKRWDYSRESNFRRDCLKSVRRVLHPGYQLPLPGESPGEETVGAVG